MFWDSVVAGLKVLTYWETYVAGLEYLAIFFIPTIIVGMIIKSTESTTSVAVTGCLSMILLPVLQVAAMLVMLLTIAPIIFGFTEDAAWSFPWQLIAIAPGAFFKLVGILLLTVLILACVPILGPIFSRLQSLQTFVLGGTALLSILNLFDSISIGTIKGDVDFIPSFWFSTGLIVIGTAMSWVGTVVAAIIFTGREMAKEGLGQIIMYPIATIFGFIPVFMYGAWLGAQIRGL